MISQPLRRVRQIKASAWLRWSYWWYYAAVGCLLPYLAIYYRHLGLNGFQIGVLAATLPIGAAFFAPIWGTLADTFAAHRLVLRSVLVLAALTVLLLARTTQFGSLLLLMMVLAMMIAAVPALLDSYAMAISEREGRPYGQLRVWGSLGFILSAWLIGRWMGDRVSNLFLSAYSVALLVGCAATFGLPALHAKHKESVWRGVTAIMHDRAVVVLLITTFLVTSSASILFGFLGIYLTEIGGAVQLAGTAAAIGALSEIPVFVFGTRLLDRLSSRRVLLLAMIMYLVRLSLYSIPLAPSWAVWVQWLHGLSFGAYLMASVTLIHALAGRARAATAQGLLTSTSLGFGTITGTLVGGTLLDQIGAVGVLRVAAVGMLVACVTYLFNMRAITPSGASTKHGLQLTEETTN